MEMIIITVKTVQNKKDGHLTLLMKHATVTTGNFITTFHLKTELWNLKIHIYRYSGDKTL